MAIFLPERTTTAVGSLTPREIVTELDRYVIGQAKAKRAVAIALRNRWRRMQVDAALRAEITPKNILMIGPTGVGKTEIARRLARLARAPFIKVEATKFTEVGYVGREVDSIIKDLMDVAVKMTREEEMEKVRHRAMDAAEERVLDALLPRPKSIGFGTEADATPRDAETRQKFRKMLREGQLDEREIEIDVRALPTGELDSLVGRLGIRIDQQKRLDVPTQVARALVSLPEVRDTAILPAASAELLHRIAEARGSLIAPTLPQAVEPLAARGIVFARMYGAGTVELMRTPA